MLNREEILSYLKEKKNDFFLDFQVVKLGIFGSFAIGEASIESDIDVIIEFAEETADLVEKKARIKSDISQRFNRKVDLCREKYIRPYFKAQILESAIYV